MTSDIDKVRSVDLGEYNICGLPTDEEFPIVIDQEGYERFEGRVRIASTRAQLTPNSTEADVERAFPQLMPTSTCTL